MSDNKKHNDLNKTRLSGDSQSLSDKTQLSQRNYKALTEIDAQLQHSDTQTGFIEAKRHANKALSENKIILNHRFVLIETLGAGGMGTVYKARDLRKVEAQDCNPYVAVKILNSDFKNHPDAFVALQREASRSHTLAHPNIVTVHDFDRDGDMIYMTMELLEGEDLESLLSRHRDTGLDKKKALQIIRDIGVALDFAHQKGIIHSDLKPGNIFVTKQQGAKVLDFGIARLALEAQAKDHFDAGRIGAITPAYASLEMLAHQSPDPRDDVYAAAIIAYELLTGRHPYQKMPAAVALANHLKPARIKKLSGFQWRSLSKALELKRQDRLANIRTLVKALIGKRQWQLVQTFALLVVGAVAWVGYDQYFAAKELRQVMQATLQKAEKCFQQEQFQCTLESANALLEMSAGYPPALSIKKKAQIAQLADQIDQCMQQVDFDKLCAEGPLGELTQLTPNSELLTSINSQLLRKERLSRYRQLQLKAQDCFALKDYNCAIKSSTALLVMNPQEAFTLDLIKASNAAILAETREAEDQTKEYHFRMTGANKCYRQWQYNCAISNLKKALLAKPEDLKASDLLQKSQFELKKYQSNVAKANKIIKDGRRCLKKLNFSCAIAKSESALEFVPQYKKALHLKRDATESLRKVKKTIKIE